MPAKTTRKSIRTNSQGKRKWSAAVTTIPRTRMRGYSMKTQKPSLVSWRQKGLPQGSFVRHAHVDVLYQP